MKRYGASPIHLIAHLALLPLAAWALLTVLDFRAASNVVLWLIAAVILHDLVLLPVYSVLDRIGQVTVRGAINYVRVPLGLSLLMLLVFWGTIREKGEGAFRRVSGLEYEGYLERWLLVSAALFAVSGVLYLLRTRRTWRSSRPTTVTSSPPTTTSRAPRIDGNVSRITGRLPAE
jgi:hypothetical protein